MMARIIRTTLFKQSRPPAGDIRVSCQRMDDPHNIAAVFVQLAKRSVFELEAIKRIARVQLKLSLVMKYMILLHFVLYTLRFLCAFASPGIRRDWFAVRNCTLLVTPTPFVSAR